MSVVAELHGVDLQCVDVLVIAVCAGAACLDENADVEPGDCV